MTVWTRAVGGLVPARVVVGPGDLQAPVPLAVRRTTARAPSGNELRIEAVERLRVARLDCPIEVLGRHRSWRGRGQEPRVAEEAGHVDLLPAVLHDHGDRVAQPATKLHALG